MAQLSRAATKPPGDSEDQHIALIVWLALLVWMAQLSRAATKPPGDSEDQHIALIVWLALLV